MNKFGLVSLVTFALASTADAKICANTVQELNRYPVLAKRVKAFGGVKTIIGAWEPASLLQRVVIPKATFRVENDLLFVQLEGYPEVRLRVCHPEGKDSNGNTLAIELIRSPLAGVDTIYARPAGSNLITLAAPGLGTANFKKIVQQKSWIGTWLGQ